MCLPTYIFLASQNSSNSRIRWPQNYWLDFCWNLIKFFCLIWIDDQLQYNDQYTDQKIRWPQNSDEILVNDRKFDQCSDQKIRWPWNSYWILARYILIRKLDDHRIVDYIFVGIWSEFLLDMKFLWKSKKWQKKLNQYFDQIIRWPWNFINFDQNYLQEVVDRGICDMEIRVHSRFFH